MSEALKRILAASLERGSALLVLTLLAVESRRDGRCCVPVSTLMRRTGLSERQVQKIKARLVASGDIAPDGYGDGGVRRYVFPKAAPPDPDAPVPHDGGVNCVTGWPKERSPHTPLKENKIKHTARVWRGWWTRNGQATADRAFGLEILKTLDRDPSDWIRGRRTFRAVGDIRQKYPDEARIRAVVSRFSAKLKAATDPFAYLAVVMEVDARQSPQTPEGPDHLSERDRNLQAERNLLLASLKAAGRWPESWGLNPLMCGCRVRPQVIQAVQAEHPDLWDQAVPAWRAQHDTAQTLWGFVPDLWRNAA